MKDIPTIIKPEIITWARKRLGDDQEVFARRMKVDITKVVEWENGTAPIFWKSAEKLAKDALIPFGLLFSATVPNLNPKLSDFRTKNSKNINNASPELQAVIQSAKEKQDWMIDYCKDQGVQPLPFAGSLSIDTPITAAAQRLQTLIGDCYDIAKKSDDYYSLLSIRIENAGVLVMRNSIVRNSTNRPLDIEEFRGFALYDEVAPLIFINSADSKSAQLFTLIHELVHIFIGQSGISNNDLYKGINNRIEQYCNAVAAEFLVPSTKLKEQFALLQGELTDKIEALSKLFKVSRLVIIRRCFDLALMSRSDFDSLWQKENVSHLDHVHIESHGGPDFYTLLSLRIGRNFTRTVISALRNGHVTYTEAFHLLDVHNVHGIDNLEKKVFEDA